MKSVLAHLDDLAGLDVLRARRATPWQGLEQHQPSGMPVLKALGLWLAAFRRNRGSGAAADARGPAVRG